MASGNILNPNIINKSIFRKGEINMENTNEKNEMVVTEKKSFVKKTVDAAKAHPVVTTVIVGSIVIGLGYVASRLLNPTAPDVEPSVDLTDANTNVDGDDCMKVVDEEGNVLGDVVDMDGYSVTMAPTPSIDLEPSTEIVPAVTEVV
jgi:hypothetical protein